MTQAEGIKKFYWDACLFYERVMNSYTDQMQRTAIDKLLADNKAKRNRIFTSSLTHVEVIPKKLGETDRAKVDQYLAFFNSEYFYDHSIDRQIIFLAREIKDFYYRAKDQASSHPYRMLSTGDSIHLATAIIHEADEFHTRDNNPKHGNVKLLGLPESSPNGKLCGAYDLRILSPISAQAVLFPISPTTLTTSPPSFGGSSGDAAP